MVETDTNSTVKERSAAPGGENERAQVLLHALASLAGQLNAAKSASEVYRVALGCLARLIPCDALCVTEGAEVERQQLRARLDAGQGLTEIESSEPLSLAHTALERAMLNGVPHIFQEAAGEQSLEAVPLSLVCTAARSFLCAPLMLSGKATGVLLASAAAANAYQAADADAAMMVSAMLAAALARIEFTARVADAESLEAARWQEEALIRRLDSVSRASFDFSQLIQHTLDALALSLPASYVILRAVSFGHPEGTLRAWMPGDDRPPLEVPAPVSREERPVYTEQRSVFIEDAVEKSVVTRELRPMVERLSARSIQIAPVIYGGQVLAALGLVESNQLRTWTREEQLLLGRVAETIAPLMLNTQLQTRTRSYIEDMLTLLRLASEVGNEAELEDTLHALLDAWAKIIGTDTTAILRWDDESKLFRLAAVKHLPTSLLERYRNGVTLDEPVCGLAASRRVGVLADLSVETRFAEIHAAVRWSDLHGMWATPIIGPAGKVLGLLIAFTHAAVEVAPDEQRLADLFTRPAAIAMLSLEANRAARLRATEMEQLEERLRQSEQYKSEFMAIISHELRTPLNAIIGYAQMLLDGFSGELGEEQRADVQIITDSADHLLRMVEDTLDLARIDAQRFPIFMDSLALDEVLRRAVATVANDADKKGLRVETLIAEDVPAVRTDPERVRQILTNLLSNAVKFTERGTVSLRIRRDESDGVRFSVADTGIGFDIVAFPHIFDDFRQMDATTTRIYAGSGLGLAVAKRLVQRLGGDIGVTSTPGEGSNFWFRLPLEVPDAEG